MARLEIDEKQLTEIIVSVLARVAAQNRDGGFHKETDESGILRIETKTVRCEPFSDTPGVYLKDIVTLDEAPRMGAGIMELDHTSFEWTLTYDEYDYVISGELEIEIDGRIVRGQEGDIIYIPRGSHIHFQTKTFTRYAYFVYPANWQEQG